MPVRDGRVHLAAAIESICNQSLTDFEFLIIDDGSTDETPEIIERYAAADDRIRVLQGHGGGITRALNLGFAAARAPFVARMDGDDISRPERLARQVAYLSENEECVAAGCSVTYIDADGDPLGWHLMYEDHAAIVEYFLSNLGFGIAHPAAMIRRDAFIAVGGYDEQFRYGQDLAMFLRLSEVGRLANLPEPLLQLRFHERQASAQNAAIQRQNAIEIARRYCARHGRPLPSYGDSSPCAVHTDAVASRCSFAARAMRSGHVRTALKHLRRAAVMRPHSPHVWVTGLRILKDYLVLQTRRNRASSGEKRKCHCVTTAVR